MTARELEGRIALVTGASRGIGRAIAVALGRAGATVAINYTANEDAAKDAAAAVEAAGGKAALYRFDVASGAEVAEGVDRVVKDHDGKLDILVCNAGIAIDALVLRSKEEDFQRTLDVNLKGAFLVTRAAAKYLLRAKANGRIITLSSVVGEQGNTGQAYYAASKAGVIGMTKALAREFASRGVTANVVSPGFIETDMTAAHVAGEMREKLIEQIPLGRIGSAEDVAEAVLFLASPRAAYMTGQVLRVNGGMLM
jgi:3-oxoacyl-[acyl-carrier protein] reductase